jgi:dCTP deaminase
MAGNFIDPTVTDIDYEEVIDDLATKKVINPDGYILHPDRLVLAWTREYIDLRRSPRLAARIEGKSSFLDWGWLYI